MGRLPAPVLPLTMRQAVALLQCTAQDPALPGPAPPDPFLPSLPSLPVTRASALRLRRYLARRAPQALLTHRDPACRKGRPYLTTLALLRDHCPELFGTTAPLVALLRDALSSLTARVEALEATPRAPPAAR